MTSPHVEDVGESDFEEKVVVRSGTVPILVDFWAPWCGPCKMLSPILERIVDTYQGKVRLAKINTDENPNLAGLFRIQGIPAVKAFVQGEVVDEFAGVLPEPEVRAFIEGLLPTEADLLSRRAQPIESAQPEESLALYQEALRIDPAHPAARIGELRMLMTLDRLDEAQQRYDTLPGVLLAREEVPRLKTLLDLAKARQVGPDLATLKTRLAQNPEDLQARWALAARQAAEGLYPEALEAYLWIVKKDRSFHNDGARKAMLELFEVIGPRSPVADRYREKLAQVLF